MQRRVLEEQVHYQSAVYCCINLVTGADDIIKRSIAFDYDKCTSFAFRHSVACVGNLIYGFAETGSLSVSSENAVQQVASLCVCHISVANLYEELPDLGLEDHDDGNYSDVQNGVQKSGHELHSGGTYQDADEVKRDNRNEDAHCRRTPDPPEKNEDQNAQKQYIEDVSERHLKKS